LLALILGYGALVRQLKARATPPATAPSGSFADAELDRYARHIMLREIGGPGQKALKSARVLVIGAGGLGSPVLLYLAAAGVGMIGVVDDDKVDASNLQRQVIHTDARIGMPKVFSAEAQMRALNPFITVRPYNRRLDDAAAREMFGEYDLILDGSDNFDTRYMVNRVAAETGKPLISAAITQWEGQISLYDPAHGTPCYECIFPTRPAPGLVPTCAEAGVVAPLPGVIGAMMALEAVKHLTGAGQTLAGEMLIYDGLWGETRKLQLSRRADCPVCAGLVR
ncbi:MAG: HesA/MoeB/ThiF family protein, partial [Paracoccaceae bacterium]|nr:HesA/MoeB/ThiF family protein [Paracoccaceae bacterium]